MKKSYFDIGLLKLTSLSVFLYTEYHVLSLDAGTGGQGGHFVVSLPLTILN